MSKSKRNLSKDQIEILRTAEPPDSRRASWTPAPPQVRLDLIEHGLDLPALVIKRRQFHGPRQLRVQQRRQQPVARLRIVQTRQGVLDHAHGNSLLGRLSAAHAGRADDAEERAVAQHALHRELPGAPASPQQIGSGGLGLAPVLESVETEGRGVVGLVGQLKAVAVNGHQSQAGIERLWMVAGVGQGHQLPRQARAG